METIFVFTHTIMTVCLIGICMAASSPDSNEQATQGSVIPNLVLKIKSIRITSASFYRTAAGLLAIFIR